MSGTIASPNPYKNDKEDNSLIQSTTTAGRYGRVVLTSSGAEVGASAAEGGTAGTATGNLVMFKGTGGTFTAAGTGTPLPVTLATQIAGEDLSGTPNALNVRLNPTFVTNISTIGTSGTAAAGTLVAAPGVGTAIYITSFTIANASSALGTAEVILSFGTATGGTAVLFRGIISTLSSAPICMTYPYPVNGNITNTALTYLLPSGAGSVGWAVQYYVH